LYTFEELRKKHKAFIYHNYFIDERGFRFHFSIDDYHFYPEWTFSSDYAQRFLSFSNKELLNSLVFSIGMSELVSYWKCACPPIVRVECGALDNYAVSWWKKLYFNGLGEFFYKNKIEADIDTFMQIFAKNNTMQSFTEKHDTQGCIIPIGGGKDSIVTLELLNKIGIENNLCYMINPRLSMLESAYRAGYTDKEIIKISRTIDKNLLALNSKGYLNGHTPISSVIAFSSFMFAKVLGKEYVVLSNESSANEGNTASKVNHQYSKSTEFEKDFRQYTDRYFGQSTQYFSLLRPWSEWQITKEFVKHKKYFDIFKSCNRGSKSDIWCGSCSKCLYVYIMLSAFLHDDELVNIFGKNLLNDESLNSDFIALINPDYDKPFECVGTRDEVRLALKNAIEKRKDSHITLPLLLEKNFKEINSYSIIDHNNYFDSDNFVPTKFLSLLKS